MLAGALEADLVVGDYPADCGQPPLGWDRVRMTVEALGRRRGEEVHLLGGACLLKLGAPPTFLQPVVVHAEGHCCDLLGGPTLVADRIRAGGYVVSPGWLRTWRATLERWRMDAPLAREFFAESCQRLVLLDSGVVPGIQADLEAFAAHVGLPHETLACGLDRIRLIVESLVSTWRLGRARRELELEMARANRQSAELLMTVDLVRGLAVLGTKEEAIRRTADLLGMLLAAAAITFVPAGAANVPAVTGDPDLVVPIAHGTETFGSFRISGIAFPEHLSRYQELAGLIAGVCGLAIANADAHERVRTLRGLLPICMHCKRIRDDGGYWQKLEQYLAENTEVQMSHGCCPECLASHYGITDPGEEGE